MNTFDQRTSKQDVNAQDPKVFARSAMESRAPMNASVVNRTHRVIRERARAMQAQRSMMRGLLAPMLVSSILMLMLFFAIWSVLDQYDVVTSELPSISNHFAILMLWFLPASAAVLAMVWVRRSRGHSDTEAAR